ncbi:MAG: DUF2784 family protein [Rhodospirillales bacterium]|nr:DUF2784 family protein [Rhodospirillales bacterium]MDH3969627.1 DUF2784 family protein [Rhodospirillales bacterium]
MTSKGPVSGRRVSTRKMGFEALNIGLHLAHQSLIVFTLIGWAFCETRLLHLGIMALVGVSWLGFGIFHGLGYCLLTDIQWTLKERMGEERPAVGYMKFLADRLSGRDLDAKLIDAVTYITCALCSATSLLLTLTVGAC